MWTYTLSQLLSSGHSFRRVVVEPKDVLLPGAAILLANIVVLTLWHTLAPIKYTAEYNGSVDKFMR